MANTNQNEHAFLRSQGQATVKDQLTQDEDARLLRRAALLTRAQEAQRVHDATAGSPSRLSEKFLPHVSPTKFQPAGAVNTLSDATSAKLPIVVGAHTMVNTSTTATTTQPADVLTGAVARTLFLTF